MVIVLETSGWDSRVEYARISTFDTPQEAVRFCVDTCASKGCMWRHAEIISKGETYSLGQSEIELAID